MKRDERWTLHAGHPSCFQPLDKKDEIVRLIRSLDDKKGVCPEGGNHIGTCDIGRCGDCGGKTPSGSMRICPACAAKKGVCPFCLKRVEKNGDAGDCIELQPDCPRCRTADSVIPIIYQTSRDEIERSKRVECVRGGTCPGPDAPIWHCKKCGEEWK